MNIANIIPAAFFLISSRAVYIIYTGDTVGENIKSRGYKIMNLAEGNENKEYWEKVVNQYKDYPFDKFPGIELDNSSDSENIRRLKDMCRDFSSRKSRRDKKHEYLRASLRWCTKNPTVDEILTKKGYIAKANNELIGEHKETYLYETTDKQTQAIKYEKKEQTVALKDWCLFIKDQIVSTWTPEYHFKDIKEKCYTLKN